MSALLALQLVAAVNIAVDPFGFFGTNQVGHYFNSERELKQRQIYTYPHRALLIGNSKMAYVNPDDLPGFGFYNAAFSAAKPSEMLTYLNAYLGDEELVVMALDHRMFLEYDDEVLDLHEPNWKDWLHYSLSLELLGRSFEALEKYRGGRPTYYYTNGARKPWELEVREYLSDGIAYWEKLEERRVEYGRLGPIFPEHRLETFREIKRLLDARGVEHVVFMNPLNAHEHEVIQWHERWQNSESYKTLVADLKEIFPEFHDYSDSIYSDPSSFWPTDFKHYRPEIGASIIREMLARKSIGPIAAGTAPGAAGGDL